MEEDYTFYDWKYHQHEEYHRIRIILTAHLANVFHTVRGFPGYSPNYPVEILQRPYCAVFARPVALS